MAQSAATTRTSSDYTATGGGSMTTSGESRDVVESTLRSFDQSTKSATGVSLFHILTLTSIGASLALYFSGKRSAAIFVGLWPPTFQALKSVADTNKENTR